MTCGYFRQTLRNHAAQLRIGPVAEASVTDEDNVDTAEPGTFSPKAFTNNSLDSITHNGISGTLP